MDRRLRALAHAREIPLVSFCRLKILWQRTGPRRNRKSYERSVSLLKMRGLLFLEFAQSRQMAENTRLDFVSRQFIGFKQFARLGSQTSWRTAGLKRNQNSANEPSDFMKTKQLDFADRQEPSISLKLQRLLLLTQQVTDDKSVMRTMKQEGPLALVSDK
jgi:hypothetical protein